MAFEHPDIADTDIGAALQREWQRLASPGTWWTGAERVAIAAVARSAAGAEEGDVVAELPLAAREAARVLTADLASTSRRWVESLVADGLDYEHYVELVGVVARLAAVDRFTTALGLGREPLPEPVAGEPSREPAEGTRLGKAWVPMPQARSIVVALDHVPAETEAMKDLHGALYLTVDEMADPLIRKDLGRPQLELVAARVSVLNQCFY